MGKAVGARVGSAEGEALGNGVGGRVGCDEGPGVGRDVGSGVGRTVGVGVGTSVGTAVGAKQSVPMRFPDLMSTPTTYDLFTKMDTECGNCPHRSLSRSSRYAVSPVS